MLLAISPHPQDFNSNMWVSLQCILPHIIWTWQRQNVTFKVLSAPFRLMIYFLHKALTECTRTPQEFSAHTKLLLLIQNCMLQILYSMNIDSLQKWFQNNKNGKKIKRSKKQNRNITAVRKHWEYSQKVISFLVKWKKRQLYNCFISTTMAPNEWTFSSVVYSLCNINMPILKFTKYLLIVVYIKSGSFSSE